jgi:branched-chain amino acid transport system substrate-binding protein
VTDAANAAQKLINVNKVHIIVGSVPSSNTNAMAPIAQRAKIPLMTPSSTNVNVTKVGEYVSRICFIDDFQGLAMAKFAKESLKANKAAIVTDSASDYSIGLANAFKDSFKKMGGEIVAEVSYVAKDQDFSSQLTRIRSRRPDVVFVPGYYQEVGNMLLQARNQGIKVPFLGGDGWSPPEQLYKIAGDAMLNNYFADHFSAEDSDPKVKDFVEKYRKKFKTSPSAMAALGYDSVYFLADAVKRNGGKVDSEGLKNQINATKEFVGVTGKIALDANRNPTKPLVILETVKDGAKFRERVNP